MTVRFTDPDQIAVFFAGRQMGGFADGEFLRIEPEERFTDVAGADGEVTRSKTNDPRSTITLTLLSSSTSNPVLQAIHDTDIIEGNGAGVGVFRVVDLNTQEEIQFDSAWISDASGRDL